MDTYSPLDNDTLEKATCILRPESAKREIQGRVFLAEATGGSKALGQEGGWDVQETETWPLGLECSRQ